MIPLPAIERAKVRYEQRVGKVSIKDNLESTDQHNNSSMTEKLSLNDIYERERFIYHLDQDLNRISNHLQYQHERLEHDLLETYKSTDALIWEFFNRCTIQVQNDKSLQPHQNANHSHQNLCNRPTNISRLTHIQNLDKSTRTSFLVCRALAAEIIQHSFRFYLYHKLYTNQEQFVKTSCQRRHIVQKRWWNRWILFVAHRRRIKRQFQRHLLMYRHNQSEWIARCIQAAEQVVEMDGVYTKAKVYHRLRLLLKVFKLWVQVVISS